MQSYSSASTSNRARCRSYDGHEGSTEFQFDDMYPAIPRSSSYEDETNIYSAANQRTLALCDDTMMHGRVTHTLHGQNGSSSTTTPKLSAGLFMKYDAHVFDKNKQYHVKDRSELDREREQLAKKHALELLERQEKQQNTEVTTTSTGRPLMQKNSAKHAPKLSGAALMTVRSTSKSPMRPNRQASRSPMRNRNRNMSPTRSAAIQQRSKAGVHPLSLLRSKEDMATTTRPKKPLTADDVRDPETISGMKCQVDWDREKNAKSRALEMCRNGILD